MLFQLFDTINSVKMIHIPLEFSNDQSAIVQFIGPDSTQSQNRQLFKFLLPNT